uniref:RNA polymerase sigma factor region1.1 domain-containing protein n=1 Tax=Erythrobacter sp. TaxID=1042 RepID=UPI00311F4C90
MATKSKSGDKDDAPLIDLNEASIKKLISKAKKKGYVTYDELNDALPQGEMSSDQIEDIQSALSDMGVQIVETDEDAEAAEEADGEVGEIAADDSDDDDDDDDDDGKPVKKAATTTRKLAAGERTDDPVRMYLREMGAV